LRIGSLFSLTLLKDALDTMSYTNNFVRFVQRPAGKPTPDVFELGVEDVRELRANEFLIKSAYISMDPALVGRMRDEDNYVEKVNPGDVMQAYGVGQVIASRNAKVKVGEVRLGLLNMQEYSIQSDSDQFRAINLGLADANAYLSVVGVTGATAYFGLFDICQPKAGETIVISAGASSVGTVVAQLAKQLGCRTVAIVSTDEKCEQVRREWGYDAAVSYRDKSIDELTEALQQACPKGADMYYDNTSGDISEAMLDVFNEQARVADIGRLGIAHLPNTKMDRGRRDSNIMLTKRLTKKGMVLFDYQSRMMEAILQLAKWVRQGKLKMKEDVMEGIENMPTAFFRMLDGKAQGKQLVKLSDINHSLDPSPRGVGRLLTADKFPTRMLAKILGRKTA